MRGALALVFIVTGCGGGADVSGSVGGESFEAGSAWWGDNFLVITELKYDCIEMSWVRPNYSLENPPGDEDKRFLQFMVNSGGEISEGTFGIADTSASPVSASFWDFAGDTLDEYRGHIGSLRITEVTGGDKVSGEFEVSFDAGEKLTGTLEKIEWCTNIKSSVNAE
jgi:hypothetical protein